MIIDFHTHAFPDKLAPRAIPVLAESSGLTPYHDGTASELEKLMDKCGIDKSVVLSIATKPSQENSVNNFAISLLENPRLIPFGSVYPGSETWREQLEYLKDSGIKGIKLHPEYQGFDLDCPDALAIYKYCGELSLAVLFHAGKDEAYTNPIHTGSERINRVCDLFPETTFVAAHLGGYDMWGDTANNLEYHDNLYLDCAMTRTSAVIDNSDALRIVEKMGAEHILLGSDSPWESPRDSIEGVRSLGLSNEEQSLVFYRNAERILNIRRVGIEL